MSATTTILVANACMAKTYLSYNLGKHLQFYLEPMAHPASRAKRSDLSSDKAGHYQKISGEVQGAFESKSDPKKSEAEKFAIEIAHRLYHGMTQHDFDHIVLVGPSAFIHKVKSHCNAQVLKKILCSYSKDYTKCSESALQRLLEGCPHF